VLALATLAGVAALVVRPTGPRAPLTLRGRPLPMLCPIRRLTGHRCPSCGLTRGVVYALRLDFADAMRANRLTPLALLLLLARSAAAVWRLGLVVHAARTAMPGYCSTRPNSS
jgi:hypothetical protein